MTARAIIDIEIDGKHWVIISRNSCEMERRGPFSDADDAEAMARRLLRFGRALTSSSGGKHG